MQQAVYQRVATFAERRLPYFVLSLLVAGLILAIIYPAVVYNIPPGHVRVLWLRFDDCKQPEISCGTVVDPMQLRYEGWHFIAPWNKLYIYDRRLKATKETYNAITKDGIVIKATVAVRQQLNWEAAGVVHQYIGPDYMETAVLPEVGNRLREEIARFSAEDVYYNQRSIVQQLVNNTVKARFNNYYYLGRSFRWDDGSGGTNGGYIRLYDILLLEIEPPPAVLAAINRRIAQYY